MVLEASREEGLLMLSDYRILGAFREGMQRTVLPAFVRIEYLAIFCLFTGSSINFLWSRLIAGRISIVL